MSDLEERQIGCVTVCFGARGGKYPHGNSLVVRGRDGTALQRSVRRADPFHVKRTDPPATRTTERRRDEAPRTLCAWCRSPIATQRAARSGPISHGLCVPCARRLMPSCETFRRRPE